MLRVLRTATIASLLLLLSLSASTPAGAVLLTVTDTDLLGAAFPIMYSLSYGTGGGLTPATFTLTTPGDPGGSEWYATAFTFQFDQSHPAALSALAAAAGTGPWAIATSTTQVRQSAGYTTLLVNGQSGFYVASLTPGDPADDITQGICLTCGPGTSTFTFNFELTGGTLNTVHMPFRVRYHDGLVDGFNQFNQLSTELVVPEPSSLLLTGLGLALVGAWGRKKFFGGS